MDPLCIVVEVFFLLLPAQVEDLLEIELEFSSFLLLQVLPNLIEKPTFLLGVHWRDMA